MQIIYKSIEEIKPYENNPRINDEAVEYVANSIKEFGFRSPIILDKNNVIICGHTRLLASKELKLKEVPCIIADDLNDEQVKALRLADNKVAEKSMWDYSKLDEELEDILNIDMSKFDFINNDIDWENVEELEDSNYEEPEHNMLECPKCHHIDRDIHFKKVGV
jgi:ParB-like chromosome segregation protein Spo0J